MNPEFQLTFDSADPAGPGDKLAPAMIRGQKLDAPRPHVSGKTMICGHTRQENGLPCNLGHAICIDTWVYGDGWLTCLDVEEGTCWQANQRGETRMLHLDDLEEM